MKKSRAFLLAAVLILQLILLPLAEAGQASASEVSDQLVFMQGQTELSGKDKNDPLSIKLSDQETITLKRTKTEADQEVKVTLPDLVDLDSSATEKANEELKVTNAKEAVTEKEASEDEGRHLVLKFAKGQSELKFVLTGREAGSGQLVASFQEDGKDYTSYPLIIKVASSDEDSAASSSSTSSASSSSSSQTSSSSSSSSTSSQTSSSSSSSSASSSSSSSASSSSSTSSSDKSDSTSSTASSSQTTAARSTINAKLMTSKLLATTTSFDSTTTTRANGDLTVEADESTSSIVAGGTALFKINFKVSGSRYDEADRWPATLTFSLADNDNGHLAIETDTLPTVAGVTPTVSDGKLTYTFQKSDLKAGQSYSFKLAVNTDNGYVNNGTAIKLNGEFKDNTGYDVTASDSSKVTASTSATITTTFLGEKGGTPNTAPGKDAVLAWRISLSVPSSSTGLNFLDPNQKLNISYQLSDGEYAGMVDPDGDLTLTSSKDKLLTWELPTPSLDEQAANLASGMPLVLKTFVVYTKPSSSWQDNEVITNIATVDGKNLQGDTVSATDTTTGEIGKSIIGKFGDGSGAIIPTWRGPTNGDYGFGTSSLTTVYDTAKLFYADQYYTATDGTTTNEEYDSNGNLVRDDITSSEFNSTILKSLLDEGLQKTVIHYDIDPHIIVNTVRFVEPWIKLYTSEADAYYPSGTRPGTLATMTVKNMDTGETRTITKYVDSNNGLTYIPLTYFGVKSNERLISADFSIQYEDSSQLISTRTTGAVFMRATVEKGYVGKATATTKHYIVTKDGTKYVHYSTTNQKTDSGEFSPIGPRTIDVIQQSSSIPIGKTDVSFAKHAPDGDTVIQKNSSNRVVADFYNLSNSPVAMKSPTVLSVLLPTGVTVDTANTDVQMYLVNDSTGQETLLERGTSAGNWSGAYTYKQTLKNKDSVDTGQQYVKFVMGEGQGALQPGYHIRAEFNVNIGDVTGPVTLKAYGGSYTGKMNAPADYTVITDKGSSNVDNGQAYQEVTDLFGDGNIKVAVASQQDYSLSKADELKLQKEVKGDLDTDYSSMAHASLGGQIDYRLNISNTNGQAITKLTLLDVLPAVGDLGITDNVNRDSQFTPTLTGEISLNNSAFEIKYSTSSNPSRQLLNDSVSSWPSSAQKLQDPSGAETPTWLSASEVTDWSKIRSFEITLKSGQTLKAGQTISLNFSMQAPKRSDLTESQLTTLLDTSKDEDTRAAWNSFAVTTNNLIPVEPERVGVVLKDASAGIIKKDAVTGNALSGVEFKLADSEANAKAGKFLRLVDGKVVTPDDSNYDSGEDYVLKTQDNGKLFFTGLKDGQTYYAVETAALDGYQLDSTPQAVKASYQSSETAITVYNHKEPILPKTGGPGAAIFLLIGFILSVLAYLGLKKRRYS
ncbi:SpaA isopeptide-forming pilin-related protein [Lactobacillus nasalidis]|nr:SpaA isopeptide-forming pilin-related protein [Lactobacillus nasalidis]